MQTQLSVRGTAATLAPVARTVTVVIDSPAEAPYHVATLAALRHAIDATAGGADIDVRVLRTPDITPAFVRSPGAAVMIGPGTPYDRPDEAESVIAAARELGVPLVAT
jgi:hypothetical protein